MKLSFEELMEILMSRHSTQISGTDKWIDWDAIYSELLDEGYESADASLKLDEFMEREGFV